MSDYILLGFRDKRLFKVVDLIEIKNEQKKTLRHVMLYENTCLSRTALTKRVIMNRRLGATFLKQVLWSETVLKNFYFGGRKIASLSLLITTVCF